MNVNSPKWAKQFNAHLPWTLMIALISIQSSISPEMLSFHMPKGLDKLIHFSIFGILGWVMTRGFVMTESKFIKKGYMWLVPLIAGLFAIVDEFHQTFVPGRSLDFMDWVADFLGAVFFMWLYKKKKLAPH